VLDRGVRSNDFRTLITALQFATGSLHLDI